MTLAWFVFCIELILFALLEPFIFDVEVASVWLIVFNSAFVLINIFMNPYRSLFFIAYILRLGIMFWDIYASGILLVPHSGGDSANYFREALSISENLSILQEYVYGGLYTKLLGLLFYFTNANIVIAQYLNVLMGMTTIFFVYKILTLLLVKTVIIKRSIFLLSFFPSSLIFSGILLQESMIIFFNVISLYYFSMWYKSGKQRYIIYTFGFLLFASALHSGVIGIMAGYIIMFIFYSPKQQCFNISRNSILYFIIISIIGSLILTQFYDVFFRKFVIVEGLEDTLRYTNTSRGGSSYLANLEINNFRDLILYGPVRVLFFLVGPLPFQWRNLEDAFSFLVDGTVYLFFIYCILKLNRHILSMKSIIIGLLIAVFSFSFIFGISVSNTGTAIRHRHKIFPVFVVLTAVILNEAQYQKRYLTNKNNRKRGSTQERHLTHKK